MMRKAAAGSMNHKATQLRLTRNRAHSDGISAPADGTGIDVWTVLIPLPPPNRRDDARLLAAAPSVVPFLKNNPARQAAPAGQARKMRLAERSADAIAVFTSSPPVPELANMSTTTKSAIAAAAFSPILPTPAGVSAVAATSRYGVFFGSAVQIGLLSYPLRKCER